MRASLLLAFSLFSGYKGLKIYFGYKNNTNWYIFVVLSIEPALAAAKPLCFLVYIALQARTLVSWCRFSFYLIIFDLLHLQFCPPCGLFMPFLPVNIYGRRAPQQKKLQYWFESWGWVKEKRGKKARCEMNIKLPLLNAIRCEHARQLICQLQACWSQSEGEDCQKENRRRRKRRRNSWQLNLQTALVSKLRNRIHQPIPKGLREKIQSNFTQFDPQLIQNRRPVILQFSLLSSGSVAAAEAALSLPHLYSDRLLPPGLGLASSILLPVQGQPIS